MYISELRIRNFRNFIKARFSFQEGVNTLIGENGSGKTNALHALRLLIDEALERNAINLREADFCRDLGQWRGHWIVISADFLALDPSEGCQLLRHYAGHMDGTNSGTCTLYFRPKRDVRKRLHQLSGEDEGVRESLKSLTVDDYEAVVTGRARGDFLDDEVYRRWVGNPESEEFPDPDEDDQGILGVSTRPLFHEVACTFVRALRDVVAELRSYRANPLLTLLRGMESSIEIAEAERIVGMVRELNSDISALDEIKDLASSIDSALNRTVGYTYGPSVTIESALPDSMEKLLQKLSLLVGNSPTAGYRGELSEQSLGVANLIYLALKLLEYELKLSSDRVAHFFLIEEPEAHVHTHVQKTLFTKLPSKRTQVIVTTHSTHVSSAAKIGSVNVLARKGDHAEVYQPARGLSPRAVQRLERYLDAVRSTLLFAKGVILVEGEAELIMIPAMLRAVFGLSPDEMGFSVISMSSAYFEHVAAIFSEERIQRPCAIVTDRDTALIDLPEDPADDTEDQARARAAQESGKSRCQGLQAFADGNRWIRPMFAEHTFEVEFIGANNSPEVVRTLEEIYSKPENIERSKARLEEEDIQIAGAEALRLADKIGKGWFALLLSERLNSWTFIPDYILRAVAFACHQSIDGRALKRIGEFRIDSRASSDDELRRLLEIEDLRDLEPKKFLAVFRKGAPNDDLSLLCQYVEEYQVE
jgi:predicted ATP-dependent endonuclease of OLD family